MKIHTQIKVRYYLINGLRKQSKISSKKEIYSCHIGGYDQLFYMDNPPKLDDSFLVSATVGACSLIKDGKPNKGFPDDCVSKKPDEIIPVISDHSTDDLSRFPSYILRFTVNKYIDGDKLFEDAYTEEGLEREAKNNHRGFFEDLCKVYPFKDAREHTDMTQFLNGYFTAYF